MDLPKDSVDIYVVFKTHFVKKEDRRLSEKKGSENLAPKDDEEESIMEII